MLNLVLELGKLSYNLFAFIALSGIVTVGYSAIDIINCLSLHQGIVLTSGNFTFEAGEAHEDDRPPFPRCRVSKRIGITRGICSCKTEVSTDPGCRKCYLRSFGSCSIIFIHCRGISGVFVQASNPFQPGVQFIKVRETTWWGSMEGSGHYDKRYRERRTPLPKEW